MARWGSRMAPLSNWIARSAPVRWANEQMLGRRFETGVDLSGGEWQKIALARAYLRDAQLLVLDEPTAALDARSEFEVFKRFAELTTGKMALFISHRFSTVRMADRIVVLAVTPKASSAGSAIEIVAVRPDKTVEPLTVIRGFQPVFAPTYWLRSRVSLPRNTALRIQSDDAACGADISFVHE